MRKIGWEINAQKKDDYNVRFMLVDGSVVDLYFNTDSDNYRNGRVFMCREMFTEEMFGDTDKKFIRAKYLVNDKSQDMYIFKDKIVKFFINHNQRMRW